MSDLARHPSAGRLLRIDEVIDETSLSRRSIYRYIESGDFPRPRKISPQRVAWRQADIEAWKQGLPPTG